MKVLLTNWFKSGAAFSTLINLAVLGIVMYVVVEAKASIASNYVTRREYDTFVSDMKAQNAETNRLLREQAAVLARVEALLAEHMKEK